MLGVLIPPEKVERHSGMAWESTVTNETGKGSFFPITGSALGRVALLLVFPMGWKGVA